MRDYNKIRTMTEAEVYGNIYGLVSMGYYLFASLMIYGLLNMYGLLKSKYQRHHYYWVLGILLVVTSNGSNIQTLQAGVTVCVR
jgi:hypothetical protein